MKKRISWLLIAAMLLSMLSLQALAETAEQTGPTEAEILAESCNYAVIEADGAQPRLTYIEGLTAILEVDGLKFKDMNGNGTLDVYEDYRQDVEARIADLISQMTPEEEVGLLFCVNTSLEDARNMIKEFNMSCQLFNLNGTPITITNTLNNLQAAAEAERLSIPMVFTSDREYNSFGGYIDKAHNAFGTAYDPDLAYELASFYGKVMRAIGIHVTFEPYANEIGAQYGENPELIAKVVNAEIRGLQENGLASCTKHWIGRGGDSNFGNARSVAQNFENWMVGWKAALAGGSEWVMTNCGGTGISNNVDVKWDTATMSYLRDTLGFQGVVVTDWWALGMGQQVSGVTNEGVELSEQNGRWLYNEALKNGTDMFGAGAIRHGEDIAEQTMANWPDCIINGLKEGGVDKENVDGAATRILRFKFNKGLFENPYCDVDEAVALCASTEWAAEPWEITSNEELRAARPLYEVELAEKLQAKSAVLVKNDGNLLPLAKGINVYVDASSGDLKDAYIKYISNFATVVETMEEADVLIGDFTAENDQLELFVDDAIDADKPVVLTLNRLLPSQYTLESADALLYLSYSQQADHGSTEAGFITSTEPWIYADLLFGEKEPGGVIVKELARNSFEDTEQWKDLAGDQGASPYVRLMVQATMEDETNYHASPNNWGDPLVQAFYGMKYGEEPEFVYSCLILPLTMTEIEEENSWGTMSTSVQSYTYAKAGEPFNVYALLRNNGADGITTVQVYDNDTLAAEKIITVCGGSWRVVEIEITLSEPGEHVITLGGLTGTITIE